MKKRKKGNIKMKSYTFEFEGMRITKKGLHFTHARTKAKRFFDKHFGEIKWSAEKFRHCLKPAKTNIYEYKIIF